MNWELFLLDCGVAVIGGCLGAALSALGGFVLFGLLGLLGFLYLLVAHSDIWITAVTGSVLLNPCVCFLGGLAATAYARKKGLILCGKDLGRAFISFRRLDILAAGGCAGLAGYLVNRGLGLFLSGKVDTAALTIVLVPLAVKYAWGMTKSADCEAASHAVPSPYRFFDKFSRPRGKTLVSLAVGLCAALLTSALSLIPETRPYAGLPVFFFSAAFLFPVFMGLPIPATHHFSAPAGATALVWLSFNGGLAQGGWLAVVGLWGMAAAQVGLLTEGALKQRFFTAGDIHIDPPAMGIIGATALMVGGLPLTGIYGAAMLPQAGAALLLTLAAMLVNLRETGKAAKVVN